MRLITICWLALGVGLAVAQETPPGHDLRAIYRYRAGDKVRITERRDQRQEVRVRRGTQVEERDGAREGLEQRYVLEVLEATEGGDLVRAVRSYEALRLLGDQPREVPVEGLRVLLTRKDDALKAVPEHGVELPPELEALLAEVGDGSAAIEHTAVLFPEAPQAEGGTWTCDPADVAAALDLGFGRLEPESRAQGTLRSVTPRPGQAPLLRSEVEVALRAREFNGLHATQPFTCDLRCTLERPADGGDPAQTVRVTGTLRGKAPSPAGDGTTLELEVDLELSITREVLE